MTFDLIAPRAYLDGPGNLVQRYGSNLRSWYKFGRNGAVGTSEEDIWGVGGLETLPTTGTTMWIACADNTNGVGKTMLVDGLDENWDYYSTTVVLQGNTPVQIGPANGWTRVHRCYQISAEPDPVGNVWIGDDDTDFLAGVPQTLSTAHAFVGYTNDAQQTEKAMLTVPRGHEALIYGVGGSISDAATGNARSVEILLEIQELASGASVANPSWAPFRRVDQHSLRSDGASQVAEKFMYPLGPFGQLTNIHLRATATAASEVLAEMEIVTYHVE